MDAYVPEQPEHEKTCDPKIPYRNIVGGLLYLAQNTRPDIMFAVNYLTCFYNNYTAAHWSLVKRTLRYLKGTRNLGLNYQFQATDMPDTL